jgi:hypothetical protein
MKRLKKLRILIWQKWLYLKWRILSLILALFLFVGCKPIIQTVYVDRFNDRVVERIDSVTVTNTDTVRLFQRGDSVFSEVIKWRVKNKVEIKRDTVTKIITTTKTITKTKVKIKEVKVHDAFWWSGVVGWVALFGWFIFTVKKWLKWK